MNSINSSCVPRNCMQNLGLVMKAQVSEILPVHIILHTPCTGWTMAHGWRHKQVHTPTAWLRCYAPSAAPADLPSCNSNSIGISMPCGSSACLLIGLDDHLSVPLLWSCLMNGILATGTWRDRASCDVQCYCVVLFCSSCMARTRVSCYYSFLENSYFKFIRWCVL